MTKSKNGKSLNLDRRGFKYPQYLRKKITIILTSIWIQIIFPEVGDLRAKGFYITNSGNALVRTPCDEKTKCLVRQICDKNWHAAADYNKSFRTYPEVLNSVNKNASNEMSEYLKSKSPKACHVIYNKPDEITRFSHAVVRFAACGIRESDVKFKGTTSNCVSIASAIMCRFRNTKASALHYRISTVLSKLTTKPHSVRKVNVFCKQASNVSSPPFRHSDL